jgi:hypothetical protein
MAFDDLQRRLVYGMASAVPSVALGLPGALGIQPAADAYSFVDNKLRTWLNTPEVQFRDAPFTFAAEQFGGAMLGAPARALGAAGRAIEQLPTAARAGVSALGSAIGFNPNLTLRSYLLGGAAATGAGAGVQELQRLAEPQGVVQKDADGFDIVPAAGETPKDADGFDVQPSATAQAALGALPWVAGGAALLGAGAAARQVSRAAATRQAASQAAGGLIGPQAQGVSHAAEPLLEQRIHTATIDNATPIRTAIDEAREQGSINSAKADQLKEQVSIGLRAAPRSNIIDEGMRTGQLNSRLSMMPFQRYSEIVQALEAADPAKIASYREAREALNELGNRQYNRNRGVLNQAGNGGAAVNFQGVSDVELHRIAGMGLMDPDVKGLIDASSKRMETLAQYMRDEGLIDASTYARFRNGNPYWVHNLLRDTGDVASGPKNPLTARMYEPGGGYAKGIDPVQADMDAERQIRNIVLRNNAVRDLAKSLQPQQGVHATGPKPLWFNKIIPADAKATAGFEKVAFREGGKRYAIEVAPAVASMLRGGERATMPFVSGLTRLYQSGNTGILRTLFSSAFAPIAAQMSATAVMSNRPRGVATGYVDRALLDATRGRVQAPIDPTHYLAMIEAGISDVGAQTAQSLSSALLRSIDQNGVLNKVLGPQRLADASQWMARAYMNSQLHAMRQAGSVGTGYAHGARTGLYGDVSLRQINPDYAASQPNFLKWQDVWKNPQLLDEYANSMGAMITPSAMQRTIGYVNQLMDIIANTPQSAVRRLNANKDGIDGIVREIAGDPAAHGGNKTVQQITSAVPYSNIMLQSVNAYGRAFKQSPVNTVARVGAIAMSTAGIAVLSAMKADEELMAEGFDPVYVPHLLQTPGYEANQPRIYVPGLPPEAAVRLTLDPTLAPFTAMMTQGFLHLLGASDPRFLGPEGSVLRNTFSSFMADRVDQQMKESIGSAVGQLAVPPAIDAMGRAAGVNTREMLNLSDPRISVQRETGVPGYSNDQYYNDPINRHVANTIEALTGSAGQGFIELMRTFGYASRSPDANDNVTTAGIDQYQLRRSDSARLTAPLMQTPRRMPINDTLGEAVKGIEANIEKLRAGIGDVRRPGTLGSGAGVSMPMAGAPGRSGVDPTIAPVILAFTSVDGRLQKLQQVRKSIMDQVTSVQSSPEMRAKPQAMRGQVNELIKEMHGYNQMIYDTVRQFEQQISQQTGRAVRIEKLDPQKGIDQFAPLQ